MQKQSTSYDDSFENCIYTFCNSGQTGTILIATNNNRSCQITLDKGKVTDASMGRSKGYNVAYELRNDGIKRASFTPNMAFPHTSEATIKSSQMFLEKLENKSHLTLVK